MTDISGFGLKLWLIASNTFPTGFPVTQFADDADGFDIPSIQITDTAMGLNGDLVSWNKPVPLKVTLNMIPGSAEDIALTVLTEANRSGKGKTSARDKITLVGVYPSGRTITYTGGVLTDAMPGDSISSASRLKTKTYMFAFENKLVS